MIVVDASAMVEALIGPNPADELLDSLLDEVAAPHLIDVEVTSALRRLSMAGVLSDSAAQHARANYASAAITRHEFSSIAERVWALRHVFTSYDSCYLALAEALGAELLTCDRKLAVAGHSARVRVIPRSS